MWSKRDGFPDRDVTSAPSIRPSPIVVDDKMQRDVHRRRRARPAGSPPEAAGLDRAADGTAVAVANVDAHVAVPAATVTEPGRMVMIMGTSTCHMVLGPDERTVPGMCGCVEDGIIPGLFGYEAGQSCVGDHFSWFVEQGVPAAYRDRGPRDAASTSTRSSRSRAARLRVGESGLLALDWWNGNRSVLVDAALSGLLVGATLATTPEEIYRALIEATAYGTRVIIETFEANGVPIHDVVACGGLAEKSPLILQIYADVTGLPVPRQRVGPDARPSGAAMFGAVAAGADGRRVTPPSGTPRAAMARLQDEVYRPERREPRDLRHPVSRVPAAPRLLRTRRERRHEGPARLARAGQGGRPIAVGA